MPLQNATTLVFIACVLAADLLGYLLNVHPASGVLWALNLNFANFFRPLLTIIDTLVSMGLAGNLVLYGLVALLPIIAFVRKSRLPSAVYCHLSLAVLVVLTLSYGPNRLLQVDVADSSGTILATMLPFGSWEGALIVATTAGLAIACIHAHVLMARNALRELTCARPTSRPALRASPSQTF